MPQKDKKKDLEGGRDELLWLLYLFFFQRIKTFFVRVLETGRRGRRRRWNRKPESVVLCLVASTIRYFPLPLPPFRK